MLAVIVLLAGYLVTLSARIETVDIAMPGADDDLTVWLIVGSDDRAGAPPGTDDAFGTSDDVPGARADIILLLVDGPEGSTMVSVPRDLRVRIDGRPERLSLTRQDGPQHIVDAVCVGLGAPADHYLEVGFDGFIRVLDAAGGIDVQVPHPVRDPHTGLLIESTGTVHLDGAAALALVRSRTPEELIDGVWQPVADGPARRAEWAGVVLAQLAQRSGSLLSSPLAAHRLLWAATGAISTDSGTGLFDLLALRSLRGPVVTLPHAPPDPALAGSVVQPVEMNEATKDALAAAGLGRPCPTGG